MVSKRILCGALALTAVCSLLTGCKTDRQDKPAADPTIMATESVETTAAVTEPVIETQAIEEVMPESYRGVPSENLSDDPLSFEIDVNGSVVALPCKLSAFSALGFGLSDEKMDAMLENGYTTFVDVANGDASLTLSIYNDSGSAVCFSDAMVDDVMIHNNLGENDVMVCRGITIGSSKQDVLDVYGSNFAEEKSDGSGMSTLSYQYMDNFRDMVTFTFQDNVVVEIAVCTG